MFRQVPDEVEVAFVSVWEGERSVKYWLSGDQPHLDINTVFVLIADHLFIGQSLVVTFGSHLNIRTVAAEFAILHSQRRVPDAYALATEHQPP